MTEKQISPMRRVPKILKLIRAEGLLPVVALYPDGSIQITATNAPGLDTEQKNVAHAIAMAFGEDDGQIE